MNIKQILMELGNRLVTEKRFVPGRMATTDEKSTAPIIAFTEWMNDTPEAVEALEELGHDWPTVHQPPHPFNPNFRPGYKSAVEKAYGEYCESEECPQNSGANETRAAKYNEICEELKTKHPTVSELRQTEI